MSFQKKHTFIVRQIKGEQFGLYIKGDQYPNARAVIYGEWIATELAAQLNEVNA